MEKWHLDYLQRILNARVYDVAIESPLELAEKLSARLGNRIWLKREDKQPVHSFKLRGAYNKMVHLSQAELDRGVVCASAGNHAQGVALSARQLGTQAVVVMPVTTPRLKLDAVRTLGAQVVLKGDSYSDAYSHALELEKRHQYVFVHPFDDPDVIAGQGTVGMEILRQHQHPLDAVFVAIGGGGLIAGVAAYIKAVRPEIKIIGVQTADSDAMIQSIKADEPVLLKDVGLFSDGTAVKKVGTETFRLTRELVDDFVTVDTDAICAAIKDAFEETRSILEPAGALGIAGMKQYIAQHGLEDKNLVAITCGANMNFDRLRFVAEQAEAGEGREALFAVTIPEERGSFKRLCQTIGQRNVTEFSYRISDEREAHVLVGLAISNRGEVPEINQSLSEQGFTALNLVDDDLSKEHLRYMVGGRSQLGENERLYRFEFPECPGALMRFLSRMHPNWNISLFHYRNSGADYGRILVGIEVPEEEVPAFRDFIDSLSYRYVDETRNPAYRLFLR
ncbi:L-threonine dehydratase biosynthetic IlvA [Polystyrenella longa]|uniref:L-threonine dehydratase n=1 Tax=Polystyrenella longa TaxID=2528007 RepID=A0A518CLZ5_9PLAN|nr:threonine ammonia-lyase, biosynthetic [Polystyrenella longa]QDU80259.1 L-threonine dehydratase biosynthetic IlvA [Polystyrenella longa]